MFVYKKLKASDVGITAFEAHKEYFVNKDNTSSLGITLIDSSFTSASRDTYSGPFNDINNHKRYFQLDHLFYKDALFNYGDLVGGLNYNTQEKRLYDKATIISISQKNFGSGIQKGTLLFNNLYKDDSKGNIYPKNEILSKYPLDKERVFYLGPVDGHKHYDLKRNPDTGEKIVNYPSLFNRTKLDDSLYTNVVEYKDLSIEEDSILNCPIIKLNNGYLKSPHSENYNFGNEDFTLTFWYKPTSTNSPKFIIGKSKTKTIIQSPESSINGDLQNTHGSASFLQPKEVDAGRAFPFEVLLDDSNKIKFSRSDQDNISSITYKDALSNNIFSHIAVRKSGSELKVFVNGDSGSNISGFDTTKLCQNKADLFIGSQGGTRESISYNKEHSISQVMIFNKALTNDEIKNVSSSITGTPYIGNIFYENGIVTLTSPTVNSSTLTSVIDNTQTITLLPTPFDVGESSDVISRTGSFSGSLTFKSATETLHTVTSAEVFNNLNYNSSKISAVLDGDNIILKSNPTSSILGNLLINTVNSSSLELNLTSGEEIVNSLTASHDLLFSTRPEAVSFADSLTKITNVGGAQARVELEDSKLITASFTIDPVPLTEIETTDWTDYTDALTFIPINDLQQTIFNESSINTSRFAARVTDSDTGFGEIFFTGSEGLVPSMFIGNLPRITMDISSAPFNGFLQTSTNRVQSLDSDYTANINFDSSTGGGFNGNNHGLNGLLPSTTYYEDFFGPDGIDTAIHTRGEVFYNQNTFADEPRFNFGPAAINGVNKFFSRYYKGPGSITFSFEFTGFYDNDLGSSNIVVELQRRVRNPANTSTISDWTDVSNIDSQAQNVTLTTVATEHTINYRFGLFGVDTGILNQSNYDGDPAYPDYPSRSPRIQFRFVVKKIGGANNVVFLGGPPEIKITDQGNTPGFKDTLEYFTDAASINANTAAITQGAISVNPGEKLKYTFNGIKLKDTAGFINNYNNAGINRLMSGSSFSFQPGSAEIANVNRYEKARLYILLFRQDQTTYNFQMGGPSSPILTAFNNNHELVRTDSFLSEDNSYQGTTTSTDEDLVAEYEVPYDVPTDADGKVNYFLKFMVGGDIDANTGLPSLLKINSRSGISLKRVQIEKFEIPDVYTISNVHGVPALIDGTTRIHKQLGKAFQDTITDSTPAGNNLLLQNTNGGTHQDDAFFLAKNGDQEYASSLFEGLDPNRIQEVSNLTGDFGTQIRFGNANFSPVNNAGVLITQSMGFTASIGLQANVTVTSSFKPPSPGVYTFSSLDLLTNGLDNGHFNQGGDFDKNNIAVQVFKNGNLISSSNSLPNDGGTRLISPGLGFHNVFLENPLELGTLSTTDDISFVIKSVSASSAKVAQGDHFVPSFVSGGFLQNDIVPNITNFFNIDNIQITKLSSSNEITALDGTTFDPSVVGNIIQFSSSHIDAGGHGDIAFTTGDTTASIDSLTNGNTTLVLDNSFFITSSLESIAFATNIFEEGPFPISASFVIEDEAAVLNNTKLFNVTTLIPVANTNDVANQGFGVIAKKNNLGTILKRYYQESNGNISEGAADFEIRSNTEDKLKYEFFVSGVSSLDYPEGAVTASLNYTQSFFPNFIITGISGSNVSSGVTFTAEQFAPYAGNQSDLLNITSSHTIAQTFPLGGFPFSAGKFTADIVERTTAGNIKVSQPLFITASAESTGSSLSSSIIPGDITLTPTNQINALDVTEDLVGGVFAFDSLGTPESQLLNYQIVDIIGPSDPGINPNAQLIEIEQVGGGPSDIQTINEDNLNLTHEVDVSYSEVVNNDFTIQFKNSHLIFENEYHCTVDDHEYNFTLNPTARKLKSISNGELEDFATSSKFEPYVTTVGLYNDEGELLVVGKLGQPVRISDKTDTTFVVRYDT